METKPKKKMGRPKMVTGARTASLHVRLSPEEKQIVAQAAELAGISVAQFICVTAREYVDAKSGRTKS